MLFSIYFIIYTVLFKVRPADLSSELYIVHVFAGLSAFLFFAQGLNIGAGCLTSAKDMLRSNIIPPVLVPIKSVTVSAVSFVVSICLVLLVDMYFGELSFVSLLVVVPMLALYIFVLGLVMIFSLLSLVVKDVQFALNYFTIVVMVVSPIAYTEAMMPGAFKILIYVNLFAPFMMAIQSLVVSDQLPALWIWLTFIMYSVASLLSGVFVFYRAKARFFEAV